MPNNFKEEEHYEQYSRAYREAMYEEAVPEDGEGGDGVCVPAVMFALSRVVLFTPAGLYVVFGNASLAPGRPGYLCSIIITPMCFVYMPRHLLYLACLPTFPFP